MYLDSAQRLAYTALTHGGVRRSWMTTEWDLSGNCLDKKLVTVHVRPSPAHRVKREKGMLKEAMPFLSAVKAAFPGAEIVRMSPNERLPGDKIVINGKTATPMRIEMTVRCRKCDNCRRQRSRLWSARALHETKISIRTWLGTLTLSPDAQTRAVSRARHNLASQGIDFDSLSWGEQFGLRHAQIQNDITKWLKRVRKQSKAKFRYLLVAEHHKSGLPHYHILIHECDPASPVRKGLLQAQWPLGFSSFKLVDDPKAATYVCKYLMKSAVARVRASARYGEQTYFNIATREVQTSKNRQAAEGRAHTAFIGTEQCPR